MRCIGRCREALERHSTERCFLPAVDPKEPVLPEFPSVLPLARGGGGGGREDGDGGDAGSSSGSASSGEREPHPIA